MGSIYIYKCDHCGYELETSGPWEFYRDEKDQMKPYGHPAPLSDEAAESGIYGLYGKMYCPVCKKVRKVILVEFKNPCRDPFDLWVERNCEPKEEYKGPPRCPVCGSTELLLKPSLHREIICPKCGKGAMKLEEKLIS